jgi:hypothetical protein
VNPGCFRECAQVAGSRGEDVVAVGCEAYHSGINGVGLSAAGRQHPGSPCQPVVDGSDGGADQEPGHGRLPSGTTAPDLGDHAAAGDRRASGETFALDQRDDVTATAFDGNECSCVQHEHQDV